VLHGADLFDRGGDTAGAIVAVQALGALAARRGDDVTSVRLAAAAEAAAHDIGAELPAIPPILEPISAARARISPAVLQRERDIGIAIGAKSILSAALAAWRSGRSAPETVSGRPVATP
jgi:hypothetical protein